MDYEDHLLKLDKLSSKASDKQVFELLGISDEPEPKPAATFSNAPNTTPQEAFYDFLNKFNEDPRTITFSYTSSSVIQAAVPRPSEKNLVSSDLAEKKSAGPKSR